jgi:hypothetical protein
MSEVLIINGSVKKALEMIRMKTLPFVCEKIANSSSGYHTSRINP